MFNLLNSAKLAKKHFISLYNRIPLIQIPGYYSVIARGYYRIIATYYLYQRYSITPFYRLLRDLINIGVIKSGVIKGVSRIFKGEWCSTYRGIPC